MLCVHSRRNTYKVYLGKIPVLLSLILQRAPFGQDVALTKQPVLFLFLFLFLFLYSNKRTFCNTKLV